MQLARTAQPAFLRQVYTDQPAFGTPVPAQNLLICNGRMFAHLGQGGAEEDIRGETAALEDVADGLEARPKRR
jgi:hypothetical protein